MIFNFCISFSLRIGEYVNTSYTVNCNRDDVSNTDLMPTSATNMKNVTVGHLDVIHGK